MIRYIHTAIKMALVFLIAGLIARFLGVEYWITTGIISVLSMQLTKKDSYVVAFKRSVSAVIGLFLATALFVLLGYNFYVMILIVLLFSLISFRLKISEGIVPILVLISHLEAFGKFSLSVLLNEFLMITIAIVVVLVFDLIYPVQSNKDFKKMTKEIDGFISDHLYMLGLFLSDKVVLEEAKEHYSLLSEKIEKALENTRLLDKDILFDNDHRYLSYVEMRHEQVSYINHIYKHTLKVKDKHEHLYDIANYITELSKYIGYRNEALNCLEKLQKIRRKCEISELPKTRVEFETRAMLYQILNELEYFLDVKIKFHQKYPNFI